MATHPKRPRDPNQLAKSIIDIATSDNPSHDAPPESPAAALGRKGGLKGGKARAMAAGVTSRLWEMTDLVEMIEAFESRA